MNPRVRAVRRFLHWLTQGHHFSCLRHQHLLSKTALGRISEQVLRTIAQTLVAFEEVVCDAGDTWFHRVYSWWILVQSWVTEHSQDSSRGPRPAGRVGTWFPCPSRLTVPLASLADTALQVQETRTNVYDREAILGARALCQPRTHLWGVSLSSPITLAQASVHRFLGVGHGVWCGCRYHSSMRSPVHANCGSAWKVRRRFANMCPRGYQDRREGCTCGSWADPTDGSEGDRVVGPCTSSGMSRMLCPRRGGGSVEVCTMKATSVAKRQCTGSAGTRGAARTGGGDDDAGGTDNQKPASRARQYVQGGCKQVNGDAAHLERTRKVNVWGPFPS